MKADNIDIEIVVGLPFVQYIPVIYADGTGYDPTGDAVSSAMVTWIGKTAVVTFTSTVGISSTGESSVILELTQEQTATLTPGIYRYDVLLTNDVTQDRVVLCTGNAKVFDTATTAP